MPTISPSSAMISTFPRIITTRSTPGTPRTSPARAKTVSPSPMCPRAKAPILKNDTVLLTSRITRSKVSTPDWIR